MSLFSYCAALTQRREKREEAEKATISYKVTLNDCIVIACYFTFQNNVRMRRPEEQAVPLFTITTVFGNTDKDEYNVKSYMFRAVNISTVLIQGANREAALFWVHSVEL